MTIIQLTTNVAGQVGINPRRVTMISTASLATITTAGYLDYANNTGQAIYSTDILDVWYDYVSPTSPGTFAMFTPTISNGVITLTNFISDTISTDGITLPSTGATASLLNFYAYGTHATTWTGPWASSQTANVKYVRNGTAVTLTIPVMSAATNSTNAITIVNVLPTYLRPTTNHIAPTFVVNNSATSAGNIIVQSDGTIIIANGTGGTFTNSGNAGLVMSIAVTYQIS